MVFCCWQCSIPRLATPKLKKNGLSSAPGFMVALAPSSRLASRSGWTLERLKVGPRALSIVYHNGVKPLCPCIADGVMIATQASPGQGTLQVSPEKASDGAMAVIVIKNRKTGEGLRYTIADEWLPKILGWIAGLLSVLWNAWLAFGFDPRSLTHMQPLEQNFPCKEDVDGRDEARQRQRKANI
jgi:hypothetical protein